MSYGSTSKDISLLINISSFLQRSEVHTLLTIHPNLVSSPTFKAPHAWSSWWDWAGEASNYDSDASVGNRKCEPKWLQLLRYHIQDTAEREDFRPSITSDIPPELRVLLDEARRLQLTRLPGLALPVPDRSKSASECRACQDNGIPASLKASHKCSLPGRTGEPLLRGMSPKKSHEVLAMTDYVSRLLERCSALAGVRHLVDVGAGQAYVSRQLRDTLGMHVLALDFSEVQTKGAERREKMTQKMKGKGNKSATPVPSATDHDVILKNLATHSSQDEEGSLTYKTIRIDTETLLAAADDWARDDASQLLNDSGQSPEQGFSLNIPLLMIALHACGSLTPDILRAFIARTKIADHELWTPRAAIIVGCCYNLLRPDDFPLSNAMSTTDNAIHLTKNHLQLAAQVPAQWLHSEETLTTAKLAIRKVAWRALLEGFLLHRGYGFVKDPHHDDAATDAEDFPSTAGTLPRLGRMNNTVYTDWKSFLQHAGKPLGVELTGDEEKDGTLESRLEVLQVLRCIMGPVVESFILLDRRQFLFEQLETTDIEVQLVNLFNQASGSGRNVAIVIAPKLNEASIPWP